MKTVFLRVLEADDKASALQRTIKENGLKKSNERFDVNIESFRSVPRSPFAYWVTEGIRRKFKEFPPFEDDGRRAKQGLATADDFRFVRAWWAVLPLALKEYWLPFAKGGEYSQYYTDVHLTVKWKTSGEEIKGNLNSSGNIRSNIWMLRDTATDYFFRPGLTWPRRTQGGFSVRAMPTGCIFADKGPAAFVASDSPKELLALLAILNSKAFLVFIHQQMAFGSYEVGVIQRTPLPKLEKEDISALEVLVRRAWSLTLALQSNQESSRSFVLPVILQVSGVDFYKRAETWVDNIKEKEEELLRIQSEIESRCFKLYAINDADRGSVAERLDSNQPTESIPIEAVDVDDDVEEASDTNDALTFAKDLISWAVGVAFGRFDVRFATSDRPIPTEPEPFDNLPISSLGMLVGNEGLPLTKPPIGYPVLFPENGILVDDFGHPFDLISFVRRVIDCVFQENAESWWNDLSKQLDKENNSLRSWLTSGFFEHHLKRYSRSRRRAPIIWQLSVPSGRYGVWLNAHRMTTDSFFLIQNDYIVPKLSHEERQLTNMKQSVGPNPPIKERKNLAAQEELVEELHSFLDEVKRVAPLWNPALDDGIVLTMAPLWRLVSQHNAWQKELKSKWTELVAGKYDWAHIAMHLWPERVLLKCKTDRSIAIAHGLENTFWIEDSEGKWQPRVVPDRRLEELVQERTSAAVKSALNSLLEASTVVFASKRRRGDAEKVGAL